MNNTLRSAKNDKAIFGSIHPDYKSNGWFMRHGTTCTLAELNDEDYLDMLRRALSRKATKVARKKVIESINQPFTTMFFNSTEQWVQSEEEVLIVISEFSDFTEFEKMEAIENLKAADIKWPKDITKESVLADHTPQAA